MAYLVGALHVGAQQMAFILALNLFMYSTKKVGNQAIGSINSLASDLTIGLQCDYCRPINEDTINVTNKERNKNVY